MLGATEGIHPWGLGHFATKQKGFCKESKIHPRPKFEALNYRTAGKLAGKKADLYCVSLANNSERFSAGRSIDYADNIFLSTDDAGGTFNVFMNVSAGPTACSHEETKTGFCKAIAFEILETIAP